MLENMCSLGALLLNMAYKPGIHIELRQKEVSSTVHGGIWKSGNGSVRSLQPLSTWRWKGGLRVYACVYMSICLLKRMHACVPVRMCVRACSCFVRLGHKVAFTISALHKGPSPYSRLVCCQQMELRAELKMRDAFSWVRLDPRSKAQTKNTQGSEPRQGIMHNKQLSIWGKHCPQ